MKATITMLLAFIFSMNVNAQIDTQKRFQSDTRKYYVWNSEFEKYELKETEYENSVIDIREIGSKTNGYIVISMVDNGEVRLHHGSIYQFRQDSDEEGTWLLKSKFMRAKITYNPKENTITYLYDGDDKRYSKLMIFYVKADNKPQASLKNVVTTE
ncbi:hypothetical protein [Flavobacterium sp. XGLA_31]|uniref:hypothetical protein n=1 Tax=Flavobacterium sp. XGLA_31 TaxID=3447666 RepID=UPI003F405BE0